MDTREKLTRYERKKHGRQRNRNRCERCKNKFRCERKKKKHNRRIGRSEEYECMTRDIHDASSNPHG